MTTIHNSNTACCSIPPVQSSYQPVGTIKPYVGFQRAYVTGPEDTGRALIGVFDIFGFWPQTLQAADILAKTLNATVVLPDLFEPDEPFPQEDYPPNTPERHAKLQAFFGAAGRIDKAVENVKKVAGILRGNGFTKIGTYGYCWGGKVTTLVGSGTLVDAVAAIHPAMLDVKDADNLAVPLGLFPSGDEPIEEYEKIIKEIAKKPFASKNAYKLYPTMHHGWAAARGNLDNPDNLKQYEDVYGTLAGFYQGVWA
ncbi:alpha/beta-hydrolase [Ramaria rubella]|nr:alpha/beta-hydrolase [Ramaria rubella]